MTDPGALCAYAAMILHSDKIPITEENLMKVLDAAGCKVQPIWANLFAKTLPNMDVEAMLTNVGGGAGATGAAAPVEAVKEEEQEPEPEESESESEDESGDDMGLDLFD